MRVVAGVARGRILRAPAGLGTRPTSDRVREAMFSILASLDVVEDAAVLDLFAGSGALGIEALSRGARQVTFVDSSPAAIQAIRANLAVVGELASAATVIQGDAIVEARRQPAVDLVLADPPYAFDRWPDLLDSVAGRTGTLVAESSSPVALTNAWETVKVKTYGGTVVMVARPVQQEGEV